VSEYSCALVSVGGNQQTIKAQIRVPDPVVRGKPVGVTFSTKRGY